MSRRAGLGRGLDALIPGATPQASGVSMLAVESIVPNPRQPRTRFDPDELAQLAA